MNSSGNPSYDILGDGAVTYPAQQFAQENQTGIYRELYTNSSSQSATSWAVTKRGNKRLRVTDTGGDLYGTWNLPTSETVSLSDGSSSAPSLTFTSDGSIGLYKAGTSQLGLAGTNGASATRYVSGDGTSINPAYSFSSESNTGFYKVGTGTLALGIGGIETMQWNSTSVTSNEPLSTFPGSIAAPGYNFTNSTNSGLSANTAGSQVSVSVGATEVMDFTSTLVTSNVPITTGTNSITTGVVIGSIFEISGQTSSSMTASAGPVLSLVNGGTNPSLLLSSTGVTITNSGTVSAAGFTSAGPIIQPQYSLRNMAKGYIQSLTTTGRNLISFPIATDTLTNWPTRTVASTFIIPFAGTYSCNVGMYIGSVPSLNLVGPAYFTINDASPVTTTSTFYGRTSIYSTSTPDEWGTNFGANIVCAAGDVIRVFIQTVSGTMTAGHATDNSRVNSIAIDWLHA